MKTKFVTFTHLSMHHACLQTCDEMNNLDHKCCHVDLSVSKN